MRDRPRIISAGLLFNVADPNSGQWEDIAEERAEFSNAQLDILIDSGNAEDLDIESIARIGRPTHCRKNGK